MIFTGVVLTSCLEDKVFQDKEIETTNYLKVDDSKYPIIPDKKSGKHMGKKHKHKNKNNFF